MVLRMRVDLGVGRVCQEGGGVVSPGSNAGISWLGLSPRVTGRLFEKQLDGSARERFIDF